MLLRIILIKGRRCACFCGAVMAWLLRGLWGLGGDVAIFVGQGRKTAPSDPFPNPFVQDISDRACDKSRNSHTAGRIQGPRCHVANEHHHSKADDLPAQRLGEGAFL